MTTTDPFLNELRAEVLDHRYKCMPLEAEIRLSELGKQGWNVARGDMHLPVTTLRAEALQHNITTMAEYCAHHGALLAPHGKTTMAPELFHRQLSAGAWGITAATSSQARVMRRFGVARIMLANELVDAESLRWVGRELERDAAFDFSCLVDSVDTAQLMDELLEGVLRTRKLQVMVEVGVEGGRTGVRTDEQALLVARRITGSRHLALVGVESYEGLAARGTSAEDLAAVDVLFERMRRLVITLAGDDLFDTPTVLVSAGGSIYFDRAVAKLGNWGGTGVSAQLLLRSGCYVSHDADRYHRLSPLDGRRGPGERLWLRDALEAWSLVLSRPEPELAILGAGKRDVPYDVSLPMPLRAHRRNGEVVDLQGSSVTKLMDQHAFMTLAADVPLAVGDIVVCALSHPCGAFDKAPLVPLIDEEYNVIDGVLTFF